MATYSNTASGGLILDGCAILQYYYNRDIAFAPNNIVYNRKNAILGIMEKICVKTYIIKDYNVLYKDTTNRLWKESDLISYDDALALTTAYNIALLRQLEDASC